VVLKECKAITDMGLQFVCQGCHQLRILDLSFCRKITEKGFKGYASLCPLIHTLNVAFCLKLTDGFMFSFKGNLKAIRRIDMSHCPRVTMRSRELLTKFGCDPDVLSIRHLTTAKKPPATWKHKKLKPQIGRTGHLLGDNYKG